MAATRDCVPTVYVENRKVVGLDPNEPIRVNYKQNFAGEPTGTTQRASLKMDWSHGHNDSIVNGIGRIGFRTGGKSAHWIDEEMALKSSRAEPSGLSKSRRPSHFSSYFATHDIHVPRVPHQRLRAGLRCWDTRGDALVQF